MSIFKLRCLSLLFANANLSFAKAVAKATILCAFQNAVSITPISGKHTSFALGYARTISPTALPLWRGDTYISNRNR